jgi:hypothetical protein
MFQNKRKNILLSLINYSKKLEEIKKELLGLPWDSDEELVFISCLTLFNVLNKGISEAELEEWANLIEGREDIGFIDNTQEIIFEIANPTLYNSTLDDWRNNVLAKCRNKLPACPVPPSQRQVPLKND